MAFSTWDKLLKVQRDYPKPKFALPVVEKALKKAPTNAFLHVSFASISMKQTHLTIRTRLGEQISASNFSGSPRKYLYL